MKSLIKLLTVLVSITALVFIFGCDKSNLTSPAPLSTDQVTDAESLGKKKPGGSPPEYPIFGSETFSFWNARNGYRGGTINLADGSIFILTRLSLTPPPEIPWGDDVTITMLAEKKKHQGKDHLVFTFGPSGCQFNSQAKVILDYKHLNLVDPSAVVLYYIDENGNYIQQQPDDVDVTNTDVIIYIDHFSRYAIGAE